MTETRVVLVSIGQSTANENLEGDFTGDQTVDFEDFLIFASRFGEKVEEPASIFGPGFGQ